jgi:hypothetical protein
MSTTADGELRLAMLGMIEGNGHPYSWSAIINGYDPVAMARCPYAAIPAYLGAQPLESVRLPGARVTHIWTDNPADAALVAEASLIGMVVEKPEDVIGQVDAVVIATDDGADHTRRAAPFLETGIPVFVDKPLAVTLEELARFQKWHDQGARFLSTSGMRFAPETKLDTARRQALGELRWVTSFTCKTWERYGIHALEAVQPLLGSGFETVTMHSDAGGDIAHITHRSGARLTIGALHDAYGSFGAVHLYGTGADVALKLRDTYHAFRAQLVSLLEWLRGGVPPVGFGQTREMMAVLIAGIRSRQNGGREVSVRQIEEETLARAASL